MARRLRLGLIVMFCTALFMVVYAQTPETRDAVFNDLSQRVGRNITLTSLSDWRWNFGSYAYVTGLGACPPAPAQAPTTGDWHRYSVVYQGQAYDYIVANNTAAIFLCNEVELQQAPTAIPTSVPLPTQTAVSGNTPVAPTIAPVGVVARCTLPVRLTVGIQGQVLPGDPNWVHAQATRSSTKIGEIPAGGVFTVLEGPACDGPSGMNYWRVQYTPRSGEGFTGWTSEGLNNDYWLEALPAQRGYPSLSKANIQQLTSNPLGQALLAQHPEGIGYMAFSGDGTLLAAADAAGQVTIWDVFSGLLAVTLQPEGGVSALAMDPSAVLLATGDSGGNIRLFNVSDNPGLQLSVLPLGVPVSSLVFNADGGLLASSGTDGRVVIWDVSVSQNPVLALIPQTSGQPVDVLSFSPDGGVLLARSADGSSVQIWSVSG